MSRTTILFGPPGTGKTTALLNEVEEQLKKGSSPDKIAFFAFTRKASREALVRAGQRFGLKEDDLPWFRTLHSAAFRLLGLSSSDVMQPSHYRELAEALGAPFHFEFQYNEDTERVPQGGAVGDRALAIYTRARSRCTSVENEYAFEYGENVGDVFFADFSVREMTERRALFFERMLDEYKRAYSLLDFSDFLDEVHTALDLDLMIIDEAQDLTQQQWAFARRIGSKAKRVIIAGDDDQAIFQWAGADVRQFLSLAGNVKVLPISYRLPENIWSKCQRIASGIRYRKSKTWLPRPNDEGQVLYVNNPYTGDLRGDQSWLMLSRLRWQAELFVDTCRAQGIIYNVDGVWSNQTPEVRSIIHYERIRRGESVSGARIADISKFLNRPIDVPRAAEYTWDDISWPFEGKPDWMAALVGLSVDEREYIRMVRNNGESLTNPGRVTISTIHGSKGGEADNVLLMVDTNKRVEQGSMKDPDSEQRVWYVGASRAKHNLLVMEPASRRFVEI